MTLPKYSIVQEARYFYVVIGGTRYPRAYFTIEEALDRIAKMREADRYKKIADTGLGGIKFKNNPRYESNEKRVCRILRLLPQS